MQQRQGVKKITIYEPQNNASSYLVWSEMFNELKTSRFLIWRLLVRDLTARFKQSLFGFFWAFMSPLIIILIFEWLRDKSLLPTGFIGMPYVVFVLIGQMVWLLFSGGLTSATNSLVDSGNLIAKISFPREALVFASIGHTIFDFVIRIPLLLILLWWTGFTPKPAFLLLPLIILPLFFLILGIGFITSILNAITRDVASIMGIAMTIGMFSAPVVYPPPTTWPLSLLVNYINPVSSFIIAARDLALVGNITDPLSYATASIFCVLVFFISWRIFHLVEPKIAERI